MRPEGHRLRYKISIDQDLAEELNRITAADMPSFFETEVRIFPDGLELVNDQGNKTHVDLAGGVISLGIKKRTQNRRIPLIEYYQLTRRSRNKKQIISLGTKRLIEFNSTRLVAHGYHLKSDEITLEIWATTQLPYPRLVLDMLWLLWLGSPYGGSVPGLPLSVTQRDTNSGQILFQCELNNIDGYINEGLDRLEETIPASHNHSDEPSDTNIKQSVSPELNLAEEVSLPIDETMISDEMPSSTTPLFNVAHAIYPVRWIENMHERIGVAFRDNLLQQIEGYINQLAPDSGVYSASYDSTEDVLRLRFDWWSRLQNQSPMNSSELTALRSVMVAAFLWGGGTPVVQDNESGGLTTQELEKYNRIEDLLNRCLYRNDTGWIYVDPQPDPQLEEESVEVLDVLRKLQVRSDSIGFALSPEILKGFVRVLMMGFLDSRVFIELTLALMSAHITPDAHHLHHTVLRFNRVRAEAYVQAQLRNLLEPTIEVEGPIIRNFSNAFALAWIGPLKHILVDTTGGFLQNTWHDKREGHSRIWTTLGIHQVLATIHGEYHIRSPFSNILDIFWLGTWRLIPSSIDSTLNLIDIRIPLRISLPTRSNADNAGYGLRVAVVGDILWENEGDGDINLAVLGPLGPLYIEPVIRELIRTMIADELSSLATSDPDSVVIPWPDLLKLFLGPPLRTRDIKPEDINPFTDKIWILREVLWATLIDDTSPGKGNPVGLLVFDDDLDSLSYVITPRVAATWLNHIFSDTSALSSSIFEASWPSQIEIDLPQLYNFQNPPDAPQAPLIDPIGELFCDNIPMIDPPRRYYSLMIRRSAPYVNIDGSGQQEYIGDFVFQYNVVLQIIERKQIARAHITQNGNLISLKDYVDDPHLREDYTCEWTIHNSQHVVETLVQGHIEITGNLLLGFVSESTSTPENRDDSEFYTLLLPVLGLSPMRDNDGNVILQTRIQSFEYHETVTEEVRPDIQEYFADLCMAVLTNSIGASRFGNTSLVGIHYILGALPSLITSPLAESLQHIRLRQAKEIVEDGNSWDPHINRFQYSISNGHAIWPVELDFDLAALLG